MRANFYEPGVQTEFFVWCDDDFEFNSKTNLDAFVNIIETSGYDVIGGGVGMNHLNAWRSYAKLNIEQGNFGEGFCVKRAKGGYGTLPGFKNCAVVDLIANFYIARTSSAGQIRFDVQFTEIAHKEWFLDSIGRLRIAVW